MIGNVIGKPDIALQIGLSIVDAVGATQTRGRSERPIASVVGDVFGSRFFVWGDGYVILGKDGACRLSRRARAQLKIQGARLRPANPCEIGRQFLLMKVDDGRGIAFVPQIATGNIYALHQIENGRPTGGIEALLKNVVGLVTARAAIAEDSLQAAIVGRGVWQ